MTTLTDTDKKKLYELHQKVETAKKELATALKEAGEMRVEDYAFTRTDGTEAKLSELFEDKTDLLVVHNKDPFWIHDLLPTHPAAYS